MANHVSRRLGRRGKALLIGGLALGLLAPTVRASFIQPDEAASKDMFTYEGIPGATFDGHLGFGFEKYLGVSQSGNGHSTHTLIQFDLTGVTLAPTEHATLGLYVVDAGLAGFFSNPSTGTPATVNLYANTESWDEDTVTWGNPPDKELTSSASVDVTDFNQWVTFDITDLVRGWLDDPATNFGVTLVQGNELNSVGVLLASSSNADASHHPYLATPEPTSLALLSLGALVMLRRRRSHQCEGV